MTKRYLGNIITQNPTAPSENYSNSAAPGVWSVEEARAYTKAGLWPNAANPPPGQQSYTSFGTYTWVAPAGYTKVSVVALGAGGAGGNLSAPTYATGGGGGGGELRYKNNITVVPGSSYTVVVGRAYQNAAQANGTAGGASSFNSSTVVANGGLGGNTWPNGGAGGAGGSGGTGDGGGNGGAGGACVASGYGGGGGGAGGYSGAGGAGGSNSAGSAGSGGGAGGGGGTQGSGYGNIRGGTGGGVSLSGEGSSGAGGPIGDVNTSLTQGGYGGSGGTRGTATAGYYGGGGQGGGSNSNPNGGFVRIIWPGDTRYYPSTNTGDV
tara:strand:+ start:2802 stop:3767 length:966 start_codon:yes stop_codon:yes gene_type:complete